MTETREITCINCPMGCRIAVTLEDGRVTALKGNSCGRGAQYARQECIEPKRMITAVLPVEGSSVPLSVKTSQPVPKAKIQDCMKAMAGLTLKAPIHAGEAVLTDVCGSGSDVVATRSVPEV